MSDNSLDVVQIYDKKYSLDTITITPREVEAAMEFWAFFKIPVPVELSIAAEAFKKDQNLATQDQLKFKLVQAMIQSDHPIFKDELMQYVMSDCNTTAYNMSFDEELEKTLTIDNTTQISSIK